VRRGEKKEGRQCEKLREVRRKQKRRKKKRELWRMGGVEVEGGGRGQE